MGQEPAKIHDDAWGLIGNLGDSQCYLGVTEKVEAIQAELSDRIVRDDLAVRLIPPAFTIGVSDGQLNGTERMRYSLIGREDNQPAVVVSDGSVIPGLDPETGRELFCLAARVLTHARQTLIRFAPAMRAGRFQTAWDHLWALPATPSG